MKFETIVAMPDSLEKFRLLERKLMRLQHHGGAFMAAKKEWERLWPQYGKWWMGVEAEEAGV